MCEAAGWGTRESFAAVTLPNGDVLVMGGAVRFGVLLNDVWRSSDDGATWVRVCGAAGWSKRSQFSALVLPNGDVLVMGGLLEDGATSLNDVWRSSDGGATWTEVCHEAPWDARARHASVVLADGKVVVMGGTDDHYDKRNDVWSSTDCGATWTRVREHAGWSMRTAFAAVSLPNGDIVVMGGWDDRSMRCSDVVKSSDGGATWTNVCSAAPWGTRSSHSAIVANGTIVLLGGDGESSRLNDVWWSEDGGVTWTEAATPAPWPARSRFAATTTPTGDVIILGGCVKHSDVWRCSMGE